MRILFWLIVLPLLALIGLFAAHNAGTTSIVLWPPDRQVTVPVYAAVLAPFLLGIALALAFGALFRLPGRLAAWQAERRIAALEARTRDLGKALLDAEIDAAPTPEAARDAARRLTRSG